MLLFGGVIAEEGALLLETILVHYGIEVTVSEAVVVVIGYFVGGANVGLGSLLLRIGVVFIGEKEVELDLGVVDGVRTYYLVQMVPLPHYVVVLAHVGPH
jgi:hypothetical protein